MSYYNMLTQLASYGKELKITEFDTNFPEDPEYEASFMRDIMIAIFSHESVEGFYMWGFMSTMYNKPIFDADWMLKESGRQYIDLVYNKWWTRESGVTGADGTYGTCGFYGGYDITVTAGGATKTVEAAIRKDTDNVVVITIDL